MIIETPLRYIRIGNWAYEWWSRTGEPNFYHLHNLEEDTPIWSGDGGAHENFLKAMEKGGVHTLVEEGICRECREELPENIKTVLLMYKARYVD